MSDNSSFYGFLKNWSMERATDTLSSFSLRCCSVGSRRNDSWIFLTGKYRLIGIEDHSIIDTKSELENLISQSYHQCSLKASVFSHVGLIQQIAKPFHFFLCQAAKESNEIMTTQKRSVVTCISSEKGSFTEMLVLFQKLLKDLITPKQIRNWVQGFATLFGNRTDIKVHIVRLC